MLFDLLDTIVLTKDVPEEGLKAGMKGAIVHIFNEPHLAYEVEFADDQGRTIAELALTPDQIEPYRA